MHGSLRRRQQRDRIILPATRIRGGAPVGCPVGFSTATNTEYVDSSGHLVIQAYNLNFGNLGVGTWYSARIKSELIQNFKYGRIESSMELPNTTNQGLWPSFRSLGTSIDTGVPFPACGEADFMEVWSPQVSSGPGGNRSTIHTALTASPGIGGAFNFPSGQANDTNFRAYGAIWSFGMMQFYVDTPAQPFLILTTSDLSSSDTWPSMPNFFFSRI